MKRLLLLAVLCGIPIGLMGRAAPPQEHVQEKAKHPRGHIKHPNLANMRADSVDRHGRRLKALPKATAPSYDTGGLGIDPPVIDQGQCGSCWDFSGCEVCTGALIKAGYGKPDGSFYMSPQYVLDCGENGGCNGDDNITVLAMCKATGLVTTASYGPYQAGKQGCKSTTGMTVYKIADWGFCTTANTSGVAATQDIKNAMVAYGVIGTGVDASQFDSYTSGVMSGNGSNIDHDVLIVGWDDTKGKAGAWKVQNSWGTSWGLSGYLWMEYGAYSIGSEACWATATALPPPPPPPPPPPTPNPGPSGGFGTITFPTPIPAGTFELAAPGMTAAGAQAIAVLQVPFGGKPVTVEPPVIDAAVPLTVIQKRLDDQDRNMERLFGLIQKLDAKIGTPPK